MTKPTARSAKKPAAAKKKSAPAASQKRKPAAGTPRRRQPAKAAIDLQKLGARVIGVTGPFGAVTILQIPTERAQKLFPGGLDGAAPLEVIEAVARDVAAMRELDEDLANSALAAAAMALAREISNPYNSATSKSMCAREMREHLDRLRELLPPEKEADRLDEIAAAREARRARAAGGSAT